MILRIEITLIVLLLLNCGYDLRAQSNKNAIAEDIVIEETFILEKLDSLTDRLFQKNYQFFSSKNQITMPDSVIPRYDDSTIIRNMLSMTSEIPLAFNDRVKRYIEVYAVEHREKVQKMLGLSQLYFPIFEAELDKRNMPHLLKYLPVVESGLNANAVSRAGATGIWQIMYSTGRMLGLNINSFIDERRDPYASTDAALNYLSNLHSVYGDWLLAIAAYNCGPGNLNKAIARSGGEKNFWKLMYYLPRETRGYVPAFLGAMYVMIHHEDYNITPISPDFSFNALDTVVIYKSIGLAHLSDELGLDYDEMVFLNPALKKKVVPSAAGGYTMKMPLGKIALFEARKDSIFKSIPDEEEALLAQSQIGSNLGTHAQSYNHSGKKVTYKVKQGDNLGFIAEWFDCKTQDIRNWNNISGSTIKVGQTLSIYVPESKYQQYLVIDKLSFKEKQSKNYQGQQLTSNKNEKDEECNCVYYEVKPGDTLWDIAKKFRISIDEIKKHNQISNTKTIQPGMVLRISFS